MDYAPLSKKKTVTKTENNIQIQLPKAYKELLLLKRYSPNTIKTYCSCFLKFMVFYEGKCLDLLSKNKIKRYLLHLIKVEKVSRSTQNQYINAVKFYYERVLNQPKIVIGLERPIKAKRLPGVLTEQEILMILKRVSNIKHKIILSLLYSAGLGVDEIIATSKKHPFLSNEIKLLTDDYYMDNLTDNLKKSIFKLMTYQN